MHQSKLYQQFILQLLAIWHVLSHDQTKPQLHLTYLSQHARLIYTPKTFEWLNNYKSVHITQDTILG